MPMTVMTIGFTVLFPLVLASNIMVDPAKMAGGASAQQIGLALAAPIALTVLLAPVTLWLCRRRQRSWYPLT